MRRGSVRTRAALGATAVLAMALVAAGVAVVLTLRAGLADNAELAAEATAREVAARVRAVPAEEVRRLGGLDGDEPVQVMNASGKVLGASEGLRGRPPVMDAFRALPGPSPAAAHGDDLGDDLGDDQGDQAAQGDDDGDDQDDDGGDDDHEDASSPPARDGSPGQEDGGHEQREDAVVRLPVDEDGEVGGRAGEQDFRFVAVSGATRDGTPVTVAAGVSLAEQEEAVAAVTRSMLIGLPAVLAVVAGVTWLVTRTALLPVEGIRRGMAEITASTDLSRRVPEPDARDEVARLARTTNATLTALERSVDRQRRFVADASHELRSPIASLRTQLEVGAAHPELLDVEGAVRDTVRLQDLAADLLLLARLDAGERPGDAPVSLDALVREELAQRADGPRPVRTELAGAEVAGSRGQLARALANLLDNAQRHAASAVRVAVRREGRWAVLEVSDDGPGVPPDQRERIFERFVRLDDARSRDEGGAGLGLAIARDVAERHGGTLTVGDAARFVLRLPAQ